MKKEGGLCKMVRNYPSLTSPITIAGVTFRNRMFSAPMAGQTLPMTVVSDRNQPLFMSFVQRAEPVP
jgi:2,4-dienoyl-CoA reductase-like NADH-dependent reductase (Old Yellow Enzyme family)